MSKDSHRSPVESSQKTAEERTGRLPAIVLDRVSKQYGTGASILEELSFSVSPGEFVSIIGPSGSGKSTVLKLVSGLTPLTSGAIAVDSMTPARARESVSFIFQDPTLLPWRTVRDNVVLGLELESMARDRRDAKVEAMLSLVGLAHVAKAYPRQLSGGMKMRVSIARALASNPRVLLLDEPFAALDEVTRDHMNEELLRIYAEQSWTVLFVTHSVSEAVFLSNRILVLSAHPGHVAHDIAVDLPFPRTMETRRTSAFEALESLVSRRLHEVQQI